MISITLLITLLIALYLLYYIYTLHLQRLTAKSLGCLPAPLFRPYDIFGIQNFMIEINGMKTHTLSHAFQSRKTEMSLKVGRDCKTFRIYYPPGETWFYTFDPRNLQAVLATKFADFQQPKCKIGAFEAFLGSGIFSADGPKWEHGRALLRPQFIREQIADLNLFETHVQNLFSALLSPESKWTSITDIQPLLERLTIDIATEFLFGESVLSQLPDNSNTSTLFSKKEMLSFVDNFFAAEKTTAKSLFYGDLYWLAHDRKFKEQCKIVYAFVDKYVAQRLSNPLTSEKKGKYVVLDAIAAEVQDPIDLRSQLLNILLAGADTISSTLGFLIASLAQYPSIFTKLRTIILEDFGSLEEGKEINLEGLKSCNYLQWTIKEVLRMYPAVPVNFREAVRDTSLPVGGGPDGASPVFIPKGHLIAWESDPTLWGPDASQFIPERWDGRKSGFHYLPFNAGPRICIGQQFAITELAYVTVRLLQRFDGLDGSALPVKEGERLPCEYKLIDKVAGGVKVQFHTTL